MDKTPIEQLEAIKSYLKQTGRFENKTVEQIRRDMFEAAKKIPNPSDITVRKTTIGPLNGEWLIPVNLVPEQDNRAILYFHGGGFVAGSCEFYRDLCSRIAESCGVQVLTVEYRLAPEHRFPAANEDCLLAYRWLLANGYSARNIVFGGDSVGGSLALMTLLSLRENGEDLPAGAFLISPHTDLVHLDGESYSSRAELDPTGSLEGNKKILDDYLGSKSEVIPLLSPLRMNLNQLPRLFIQVGDQEVLLSDSLRFTDRARAAGVAVELEVWENMWSVFHFLAYMLPEARQAITNIGQFIYTTLK
ncbi:alpha/beta hydrolase [Paenibacillus contaminans]|uniref:Alpha/beta hydrolase n=1 Tax=Paenibacillus contaminans TaxID=450362 RepID=A0A329LL23_9BACL|nr:alpha/beta hydrolase [Paenibacillus contaminans]RAV08905.1 alpha/beta hydrolase [Paenibacillus contaminans]